MTDRPEMVLFLSDARGVYIPRDFAQAFIDRATDVAGVSDEDWAILEVGPTRENESYWDVWDEVCNDAVVTDAAGVRYTLHQEGDLWLVPEGMEWNDDIEGFAYPEEEA